MNGIMEKKHWDWQNDNTGINPPPWAPTSGGLVWSMIQRLPIGDTSVTRDGNQVFMRSLDFGVHGEVNAAATRPTYLCGKVILFHNDTLHSTTADHILETISQTVYQPLVPINFENKTRFKILKQFRLYMDTTHYTACCKLFHVKLNTKAIWDTATNMIKGEVILLLYTNDDANPPDVYVHSRITFNDC